MHSNGFSLVRKTLLEDHGYSLQDTVPELNNEVLGQVLLTPTKLYVKPVLSLLEQVNVKGMAHITGGGFIENIPRVLPENVNVNVEYGSWPVLPIFSLLQQKGNVSNKDMFTTFNMGIGLVIVVSEQDAKQALSALGEAGETPYVIGKVTEGTREVTFTGVEI
ncbi:Phosphoribosylformylglycinamidine cyclo-ligase [compost metagenome]